MAYASLHYETGGNAYVVGGCCAIAVVKNFPDDGVLEHYKRDYQNDYKKCLEETEKRLAEAIPTARAKGKSILLATVNSNQTVAEGLLIKAGFTTVYEDWAYRDPEVTAYRVGVKIYTYLLYQPVVPKQDEEKL